MVALYDYNPREQSPLDNPDAELAFKKGHVITVLGPMNKDGLCPADIDGRKGLVPDSFLGSIPGTGEKVASSKKNRS